MSSHVSARLSVSLMGGLACAMALAASPTMATAAPRCPNLTILLDESASMKQTPAGVAPQTGELSKWQIATTSLKTIVNKYDGLLPLGYSNFPYRESSCDTRSFDVPVGYGTKQAIIDAMFAFPTAYPWNGGSTPTCTAVANLAADPALKDTTRAQYILLVTDGAPEAVCCGADPVKSTVDAITAAAGQSVPIHTIVVGFGNLPTQEQTALDQMAFAGGVPDSGTHKYFSADSAATLDAKLSGILKTLVGGDAGAPVTCEDGCYGAGCPSGQVCYNNACVTNTCSTQTCPSGQSCLFSGTTGTCVAVCSASCPLGTRCDNGSCVADACGGPCPSGQMCNTSNGQCVADPKCANVACHTTQGCVAGKCVDNPCTYTTCPAGTQCVDFSGMCMPARDPNDTGMNTGCQCDLGGRSHASELGPLGALLVLALLMYRRQRRQTA